MVKIGSSVFGFSFGFGFVKSGTPVVVAAEAKPALRVRLSFRVILKAHLSTRYLR